MGMTLWAAGLLSLTLAAAPALVFAEDAAPEAEAPVKAKKKKKSKKAPEKPSKYKISDGSLTTAGSSTYRFDANGNPVASDEDKKKTSKKKKKKLPEIEGDGASDDSSENASKENSSSSDGCTGDSCSASAPAQD